MMSDLRGYLSRALPLFLILTFFVQGLTHARHASLTFDEGPHLAVGYATLRTGDFRLQPVHIHPPLANVLAAGPLLFQQDLPDPEGMDGWEINSLSAITDGIVWQYPHPRRIAVAGRLPILLLGMLLGALIFRWARDLGGGLAGLLALALYAFDPNFIAHGSLITTDMAAVFFSMATLYLLRRSLTKQPPERSWIGVGVLLGLAQLAKVSALMLVPVVGVVLGVQGRTFNVRGWTRRLLWVFVPAGLVVWAGYGFEIGSLPGWPFPLPAATHLKIFLSLREHYALGHPTFLMGRVSDQGWWWYFPIAFCLKTPLPVLALGAWCVVCGAWRLIRTRFTVHNLYPTLTLFPLLYAVASFFSTVNIGYRHLLPLLPFLYLGIGICVARIFEPPHFSRFTLHASRFVVIGALVWLIPGSFNVAPHYLAFFNELAGGPDHGYNYLVDSNLDWGQNLWDLRSWMESNGHDHVYYAHYSPARPQAYGINADFLPPDPRAVTFTPWRPQPGLYAVGATVLQGPYAPDLNTYAWFRSREPTARLGHALFVYDVRTQPTTTWAGVCTHPDSNLPHDVIARHLGVSTLRTLRFNCEQSWAFANQGEGIYILPSAAGPPATVEHLLEAREPNGDPAYRVYTVNGVPRPQHLYSVANLDGPLRFLGYQLDGTEARPKASILLQTFWKVENVPARPLSLMAHLTDNDGVPLAVGDGLGVPLDQWQVGDIIVQRHPLNIPADAASEQYVVYTGGYWLDTMERWTFEGGETTIRIEEIHVKK